MYFHFYVLCALGLCIALFAVGYTYFFLIDQAQYQNHYYLICLVSTLMILVPAHRALSLDAQRWPPSPPISPCKPCSPCATGSTPAMSAGPRKATATPGI